MPPHLYTYNLGGVSFVPFCGGGTHAGHGNGAPCLTTAAIPGVADAFARGDASQPFSGGFLRMEGAELDRFALGWAELRGLQLAPPDALSDVYGGGRPHAHHN